MEGPRALPDHDNMEIVYVNGVYKTCFYVAADFFGFIVGPNGVTRTRIQNETATSIVIPRGSGNIYIRGPTRDSVRKARQEIELIVASSRDKLYTNHLNTVRITVEAIRDNYLQFKRDTMEANIPGLTRAMFVFPVKLHITINVMALVDQNEIASAEQLLNQCVEEVIMPAKERFERIIFNIPGVSVFKGNDPRAVKVVYGRVESDSLQIIANEITARFVERRFSKYESPESTVEMHMTMINTRYEPTPRRGRYRANRTFDATSILQRYGNFNFGTQEVTEILLCSMLDMDRDGFYKKVASVTF